MAGEVALADTFDLDDTGPRIGQLARGERSSHRLLERHDHQTRRRAGRGVTRWIGHDSPIATATVFVCENASTASAPFSRP